MKTYLQARREAGTPRGIEYADRLAAMPPDYAADEIFSAFALCADEDLAGDIEQDLQLDRRSAERVAAAIIRKRGPAPASREWPITPGKF